MKDTYNEIRTNLKLGARENGASPIMTAKEMFEELDFKQINNSENNITYQRPYGPKMTIDFNAEKWDEDTIIKDIYVYCDIDNLPIAVNMEELKAINKQVEELGWK